jgi:GTPase
MFEDNERKEIEIKEITIAFLGNANSGKSSTIGILTKVKNGKIERADLDDGNGKSRASTLRFIQEKITGMTSSISFNYMKDNNSIISLVDMAGQETYLKTTIRGITTSYPDYALLCIEKSITKITLEHLSLISVFNIPFGIIMTKADLIPAEKMKKNISHIMKYIKQLNKRAIIISDSQQIDSIYDNIPIILTSNVSGAGYERLIKLINTVEKIKRVYPEVFVVDAWYRVQGFGIVVCGMSGIRIEKGAELKAMIDGEAIGVRVRSIHNDYREFVDILNMGQRGSLCIKIEPKYKRYVRCGLILSSNKIPPLTKNFVAKIHIFRGALCTIKRGFHAYINMNTAKGCIKFNKIHSEDGQELEFTRANQTCVIEAEFVEDAKYITSGQVFIFRDGKSIGFGKIEKLA